MNEDAPNRILEFLTAPPKPDGEACRSNRRRRSAVRVELAWAEGDRWRSISARLRNISRGGACLSARSEPMLAERARLRFVEGDGSPWIEARILAVEAKTGSRHRVRIRFEQPCPSFLLGLAVLDHAEPGDEVPARRPGWKAWDQQTAR